MPVTFGAPLGLYLPLTGGTLSGALAGTSLTLSTPLAVAQGGTGDTGTAWTAYTPTIAALTGVLTSYTSSGRSKTIGKTVFFSLTCTITNNGTGSQYITATLPVTGAAAAQIVVGRESATSGVMLFGSIASGGTTMVIGTYLNAYPVITNSTVVMSGSYESA